MSKSITAFQNLTSTERDALSGVPTGTVIFNSTTNAFESYNGATWDVTGEITLAALGASPNANAASASGQTLTLQPASVAFPGAVTIGTQVFGGGKTLFDHSSVGANSAPNSSPLFYPGSTYSTMLSLEESMTSNTADFVEGLQLYLEYNPAGATASQVVGLDLELQTNASNSQNISSIQGNFVAVFHYGTGAISNSTAIQAASYNLSSGTINNLEGIVADCQNGGSGNVTTGVSLNVFSGLSGSGNITTNYGILVNTPSTGAGTITTNYGLQIADQSGVATTSHNLYSAGVASQNYFEGKVGIGVVAPSAKLELAAGTTSVAPLKLTAGTNLTSPVSGAIEYDGTNLYYTNNVPTRLTISTGGSGANTALSNLASVAINAPLSTGAGTALALSATAPAAITTSQTGIAGSLAASNAVAGSSVAGAAVGGQVTITAGNAARLTSGNANGGDVTLAAGSGIGTGRDGLVFTTSKLRLAGSGNLEFAQLAGTSIAGTIITANATSANSGNLTVATGTTSSSGASGDYLSGSGDSASASGTAALTSGAATGGNASGQVSILSGASASSGSSGNIVIQTGATSGTKGRIKLSSATVLTSNDQVLAATFIIDPSISSFAAVSSAGTVTSNTSTPITNGVNNGQLLQLVNTGANTINLKSGGNVDLPGLVDYALTASSSISFIWYGSIWYTTSFSVN